MTEDPKNRAGSMKPFFHPVARTDFQVSEVMGDSKNRADSMKPFLHPAIRSDFQVSGQTSRFFLSPVIAF
ncbi:MAG: hypothetical protein MI919_28225 [Holophagales bacterium]|nr:hypothetical protein [Holophagales bacterium]